MRRQFPLLSKRRPAAKARVARDLSEFCVGADDQRAPRLGRVFDGRDITQTEIVLLEVIANVAGGHDEQPLGLVLGNAEQVYAVTELGLYSALPASTSDFTSAVTTYDLYDVAIGWPDRAFHGSLAPWLSTGCFGPLGSGRGRRVRFLGDFAGAVQFPQTREGPETLECPGLSGGGGGGI